MGMQRQCLGVAVGLLTVLGFACATPSAAKGGGEWSSARLYEEMSPAVVFIKVRNRDGDDLGSGVVLHHKGFIATAAHVVENAVRIRVEFQDGSKLPADIATLSRSEDLALLKVDALPPGVLVAKLADSDRLRVGDPVYCIGSPLGLKHTLTTGIISALREDHGSQLSLSPKNVIQTDAAINQGNSGGALFNRKGEVIGIASFIATQSGGSVGLGFAVPSNAVRRRLFDRAIPYIGLILRRVPEPLARLFHWPYANAMLVEKVQPGTAAAHAGLRGGYVPASFAGVRILMGGDLIVQVGDFQPNEPEAIHALLQGLKQGDVLRYSVLRGGRRTPVEVTIDRLLPIPKLSDVGR